MPTHDASPSREQVLAAIQRGDVNELRSLVEAGGDLHFRDTNGYDALIRAAFTDVVGDRDRLLALLQYLVDQGVSLSGVTTYSESAVRVLARTGKFEAVAFLLKAGADRSPLRWTALHEAAALGTCDDVERAIAAGEPLEVTDSWSRTPWLLAILSGDIAKAELLAERGCNTAARGHCGQPALHLAAVGGETAMLSWLLQRGEDVNQTDEFGATALQEAVECDDLACAEVLLGHGADIERGRHGPPLKDARSKSMALALLRAGADPVSLTFEVQRVVLGLGAPDVSRLSGVSLADFERDRKQTVGTANPTRIESPFREAMIRAGVNAYRGRGFFVDEGPSCDPDWCAERFGQSLTLLPDGRSIQIAGEHEDFYDPDFCIYADVFVHHPDGSIEIYEYPESTFQPTDWHTATLVEDHDGPAIYVIGNLGYMDDRRESETPIVRLDLRDYRMTPIAASGRAPGWIHRHRADLVGNDEIRVTGGELWTSEPTGCGHPVGVYFFDVRRRCWRWARDG